MRYEHIVFDMSTAACDALIELLKSAPTGEDGWGSQADAELLNLQNELLARLQRHDQDPHVATDEELLA